MDKKVKKLSNYLVRGKCILSKQLLGLRIVVVNTEVSINVNESLERPLLLITSLTVTLDVWSIS